MKDLNFRTLQKLTVTLIFVALLVYILIVGQSIIVPLVISVFLAFLLIPLTNLLQRIHFHPVLAAITSVVVAIILVAGIFTLLGSQISRFSNDVDEITRKIASLRQDLPQPIKEQLAGYNTDQILTYVQEHMGSIFSGLTGFISSFTVVFLVPIYIGLILIYRDRLRQFLFKLFDRGQAPASPPHEVDATTQVESIRDFVPKVRIIIQKYITGMFYVICILFVLYSTAFYSIGVEHAMLFAAIAASFNVIPFIGPFIGSLLPMLYAFITKDSLLAPVLVLGSSVVIQSVEGNFLTPKIVGSNVSLNPLVTLIALVVGGAIWGIVGMILFIPMAAILKEIFGAVDGLKPFAYVMSTDEHIPGGKGFLAKTAIKVRDKLFKKGE